MTPEQEEQVRDELAAAGPDEPTPMPPDVVARLRAVLDDLVEPRVAARARVAGAGSGTDPLARRRRRRWPDVLVAAAAVVVIAGAGAAVVTSGGTTSGSAGSGSRAESAPGADRDTAGGGPRPSARALTADGSALPRLRTASLRADLRRLAAGSPLTGPADATGRVACARPVLRDDERLVAVRLDGRRATLVLGPAADGVREARIYSCGDGSTTVARASVPVR